MRQSRLAKVDIFPSAWQPKAFRLAGPVAGFLQLALLVFFAALGVVWLSCARNRQTSRAPKIDEQVKNEQVFKNNEEAVKAGIYEEFVDSLQLKGQSRPKSVKAVPAESTPAAESAPGQPPESPAAEGLPPSDVTLGFRVQLGAYADQPSAETLAAKVRQQIGSKYPVYVRFYTPLWKVQVGDCRSREEAETLRRFLHGNGYPDAWTVSSGIKR